MSGGKHGVPVGSVRVSGGARAATLARPRLLNRLPDDRRRGGERESSPAPKRQKFSCSNVCVLGVHSIKMHTFSQKELSPPHSINAAPLALSQSSAGPPPTQVIAAHPTTKPLKPLCQFMSAWKVISGISRWLLTSPFPPQGEQDTHPQLSGRLADFSSVPGHATPPHRLAAYSLGVPRAMCKQAKEHSRPESVHYISGSLHGLPGNESPPLAGTRGGHFGLPAPLQRRQLCSFEEISEAAGTHGVSLGSMSSGLITHATAAAMAEISSPLDSMDFGTFVYRGHLRLHRSSGAVAQPGSLRGAGESPWVW